MFIAKLTLGFAVSLSLIFSANNYPFAGLTFDFNVIDTQYVSNGSGSNFQKGPYGMVIDPEGKMWIGFHDGYSDQVSMNASETIRLTGLRCILPDSTEASFSPIELIEFPDHTRDTLYIGNPKNGFCRGISSDKEGNILYTAGSTVYKLDYRDGSGIAKFDPGMIDKPLRTHVSAVQDCSLIYFAPYPQFEQLHILNDNLEFVAAAIPQTQTIQNAIAVRTTPEGKTQLFSATHLNGIGILVYESDNPGSQPFTLIDTIGNLTEETDTNTITYYAWANSMDWVDKENGIMIFGNNYRAISSVSSGNPPENYLASRWVVMDVTRDQILYWLGEPWYDLVEGEAQAKEVTSEVPGRYLNNQAMGMSPYGAYAIGDGTPTGFYLTDQGLNCIQLVGTLSGIGNDHYVPYGLELHQNYPNPFNPMSTISFELQKAQKASLDIYDLRGKKVMNIYSGYLESGRHNMSMDATGLASGTYIYTLHTNALSVSKKMTVLR